MFTHIGKRRTVKHNLQIASLLSFVAGLVNVAGFLAVARLTTNVTGHFAFFVDEVFKLHAYQAFMYFLYIFCFFLGSFSSSFLVEIISRRNAKYVYVIPTLIEASILVIVTVLAANLLDQSPNVIACILLFAMGLQNSLVTRISNATVRTTHLTGLFTDLGIEVSQLFFYREADLRKKLKMAVKLRLTIISFFFLGGLIGGIFYTILHINVLLIGSATLAFGILSDILTTRIKLLKRKLLR
ncbi:MAG: DUF1275 domain-containing protein [Flavobacterium sp.]|nr:MAG: DUF1275 domain-containing protein [Flavobacterium sp.]